MDNKDNGTFDNGYSERFEVLRSMALGLCSTLRRKAASIQDYHELLRDELEMSGVAKAALRYVEDIESLTKQMEGALDTFAGVLPQSDFSETLRLDALVKGVLGQYSRLVGGTDAMAYKVSPDYRVRCNGYQFQQFLFEILECLDQMKPDETEHGWSVTASRRFLSAAELSKFRLGCAGGDFIQLVLSRPGAEEKVNEGTFAALAVLMESEDWEQPLLQTMGWLGKIQLLGGDMLLQKDGGRNAVILLLPEPPSETADEQDKAQRNDKTILLVDDEDMVWDVISAMLGDLGYEVLLASNGRDAIDICKNNPGQIDLVMLDMLMPELSGRETFFLLKEIDPNVKVLMTSGYVSTEDIQDVLNAGACGFLQKPYRMKELETCISDILRR